MRKYASVVVRRPELHVPDLDGVSVQASFRRAKKSSPGCDGWAPSELADMPICAAQHLSKLLNCIESGAAWPEQLTTIMV
eukprot:4674934-Alexandrium_andersonii.AAC.1